MSDDNDPQDDLPFDAGGGTEETDHPADDPETGGGQSIEREERLNEWEQRLEQRERELDQRAQELDQRERELDQQEEETLKRREQTVDLREELEDKEAELAEFESNLEDRRTALNERERELDERAQELDREAQTLEAYVGDQLGELEEQLGEQVESSVTAALEAQEFGSSGGRLGALRGVSLGLIGLVLVVGAVANVIAMQTGALPTLFAPAAATLNYAAITVLLLFGLSVNLAAAAGRV
jgi:ribonuclease Y